MVNSQRVEALCDELVVVEARRELLMCELRVECRRMARAVQRQADVFKRDMEAWMRRR